MENPYNTHQFKAAQDAFYEVMGGERYVQTPEGGQDLNFSLLTEFTNQLTVQLQYRTSVEEAAKEAMRQMFPDGMNANGQLQPGYNRGTPNDGLSTDNFDDRYHAILAMRLISGYEPHRGR